VYKPSPRVLEKKEKIARWQGLRASAFAEVGLDPVSLPALEEALFGTVVLPGDPDYDEARQIFNTAFQAYPKIIAYCEVENDVRLCLRWATEWRRELGAESLPVTCRSGGHSYAGYSICDGMVVDLSRMNDVHVDPGRKRLVVGPGARWEKIDAVLDFHRLHVPGGTCGTVAVGGFVQGGGYGFTSRRFGMNCDNVLAMRVMLADGRTVIADPTRNRDLFWAMRGGTGNNFGVLLGVTYALHELGDLWGFRLQWGMDLAPAVLQELQRSFTKTGPPKLGYLAGLTTDTRPDGKGTTPALVVFGMYDGPREEGLAAIEPLFAIGDPELQIDQVASYLRLNHEVIEKPYPVPDPRDTSDVVRSAIISDLVTLGEWKTLCELFQQAPNLGDFICIEPYGGAINAVPAGANAFMHRDADMDLWAGSYWGTDDERPAAEEWLESLMVGHVQSMSNDQSYQNYPNRTEIRFRSAYWAQYFPCLLRIKQKYDPHDFFHYQQCVSPAHGPAAPENEELCRELGVFDEVVDAG